MNKFTALVLLFSTMFAVDAVMFATDAVAEDKQELVFIFQKQKDPAQIKVEADKVAAGLSAFLGRPVKAQVPTDYSASVQALVSKKADVAYADSMAFLLAKRDGGASLLLAEQRVDPRGVLRTDYDSIFVVAKESPLQSFQDLKQQASELKIIFTSPTSTSGYLIPYLRFTDEGLLQPRQDPKSLFKSVGFAGGYVQALQQVLRGQADVAAVSYYTMEGDSAERYLPAAERDKLRILDRTSGVPTHVIAVRGGLDEGVKQQLKAALLRLAKDQPKLLSDVYGTASFVEVNEDAHVAKTAQAVEALGIPLGGGS